MPRRLSQLGDHALKLADHANELANHAGELADHTVTLASIQITVRSAMAGGPPASPRDKDIWIATDVDANGTRWMFQYNATSASPYKWEFIGGAAQGASITANHNTPNVNVWTDLSTIGPSVTVARAGDYVVSGTAGITGGPAGTGLSVGIARGAADANNPLIATIAEPVAGYFAQVSIPAQTLTDVVAGGEIRMRYFTTAATMGAQQRRLSVSPVRVA